MTLQSAGLTSTESEIDIRKILFDSKTTAIVKRFVSTAVGEIYKIRCDKLRYLEAPMA